jgi:4,5-dihydroxyphthalate decarboxylase
MSNTAITLMIRDYDFVSPLICGDLAVEGIDLTVDRVPVEVDDLSHVEQSTQAAELSFGRYLIDIAENNFDFVGIPVFVCRSFRHRCFFVRKGSEIQSFKDLEGKRVGTDSWPASGNIWSRAALREQGVALDKIQWWEGSIDNSYAPIEKPSEISPFSPDQALKTLPERKLESMLIEGELDALMCPMPPERFYDDNSQIVRLLADFKSEEQAYYRRTGVNPGHHIIGLRRSVFEQDPSIAKRLYTALNQSMAIWMKRRLYLAETSAWLQADIEESMAVLGRDWQPNGIKSNQKMIKTLCDEEYNQGIIAAPLDSTSVFADFEKLMET